MEVVRAQDLHLGRSPGYAGALMPMTSGLWSDAPNGASS